MVAPMPKTPRHQLTEQEQQLCREALLSLRHERRIRRAQQKNASGGDATGKNKKASRKKPAKHTTPAMEVAQSKEAEPLVQPAGRVLRGEDKGGAAQDGCGAKETADEGEAAVEAAHAEVVADMVESVVTSVGTPVRTPTASSCPLPSGRQAVRGVVQRTASAERSRKRRRRVLQAYDGEASVAEDDGEVALPVPQIALACVVNGDANLMPAGAEQCTGLNSDEDPSLPEDCEDEEGDDDDDDDWVEDWDIGHLSDEDSDEAALDLPDSVCLTAARNKKTMSMMRTNGWEYDPEKFGPDPTYAGLYDGSFGPSDSVMAVADDPLALLFYFMPPKLWSQIAVESNRYHTQSIPLRARPIRSQQRRNGVEVEELCDVRRRLAAVPEIMPHEVLRVLALLIARMLMPIRKSIAAHWSTKQVGALPTNRFNLFMAKNRFFHIMGYLHFSNNKSPQASVDRAWKIRPVVDVLQRTFARGYRAPPVISFDEATLPSRSRYNPTRQFNKDKPHKWGTKVFVAACAKTAYCMRIEVYCGAKTHLRTPVPKDNNTGEAAVLRNLNALCPPSPTSPWRLVVTDRFYTSVKLALELLHRRFYITGTIKTDRTGYAKGVITAKDYKTVNKKKVMIPPQGTIKLAQSLRFPQLTAAMWMDRTPVHLLSSGGSRKTGTVMRRVDGEMQAVPAPELVCDYHRWMGGVDIHDQLRMQRYSVQLCYKTRKYYKTLFLGLLDMALVNAFIVFRHHKKVNNKRPPKHFAFFETLMEQLLAIDSPEAYTAIESDLCAGEDSSLASTQRIRTRTNSYGTPVLWRWPSP
ncbi:hypothetical protein PF004_g28617 [Phytophthora fragariae]|uniref:PiggyBac transposable element-derived protein domain-containing protein n=1 Tax=Phytophthora fragariae TaxID=53985 RepID=A0A6G0MI35_9STRA|nr:hypothetical protein PF004_g28617 [Phytophthora fragariae]